MRAARSLWCCSTPFAESEDLVVPEKKGDLFAGRGQPAHQLRKRGHGFKFWAAGNSRQHPEKSAWTNADIFFASESLIGIADGVSAVELEGVDPSLLPRELLDHARSLQAERLECERGVARFDEELRQRLVRMKEQCYPD